MTDASPDVAAFLGDHPFFARLTPPLRRWLAGRFAVVRVHAGEWLFEQGADADSLYLVTSGRLELWRPTPAGLASSGTVGAGGSVGEVGILTGEPHPVSVRAVRDSELVVIDRAMFLSLVQESKVFSSALLAFLGEALAATDSMSGRPHAKRSVLTVVPVDDRLPTQRLRDELVLQLRRSGPTAVLEADADADDTALARRLDDLERGSEHVVLAARPPSLSPDPWNNFCLRQADRVIVLVGRDAPQRPLHADERLRSCELVFTDPTASRTVRDMWFDLLEPRAHHHVGGRSLSDRMGILSRRVTGRSLGVVLSGGGARGLAHIGVLQGLLDAGLAIDRVGGTSMGAFVGSMFANGSDPEEIVRLFRRELVDRHPFNDYTVPVVSMARGVRAQGMMERLFDDAEIQDLPLDFFCVTADLVSGESVVHRRGDVINAVGASMSIPGWAPPLRMGDQILVDGGVLNNFPVDIMAATEEGPIVGVDAMGMGRKPDDAVVVSTRRRFRRPRSTPRPPNVMETLAGAATLGSRRRADANAQLAALVVRPVVSQTGLLEFERLDELFDIGRKAAADALAGSATLGFR